MFNLTIIGNLGADAEVRDANGKKFIALSIADSRKFKKEDGTEQTVTNWYDAIISNVNHPVLPFLKQGVKVCVQGQGTLRVFSSKKDRMMKAGATCHVETIELCGGAFDSVPRRIIDPETAQVFDVTKHYWINVNTDGWNKDEIREFVSERGQRFRVNKGGFVVPVDDDGTEKEGEQ